VSIINTANHVLTLAGDMLLAPFARYPLWGLAFWAAVSGVVMTLVFGVTSSQRRLADAADRTRAQLLAIKLFKDDLTVTWKCQMELLRATARRLTLSLPPMLVMLVPFVIVLAQLAVRYENRPLIPGNTALVELRVDAAQWDACRQMRLRAPRGIEVETEALRDPVQKTFCWRIRPHEPGHYVLNCSNGHGAEATKSVAVSADNLPLVNVTPRRAGGGILEAILFPAEPALDGAGPIRSIGVTYPRRTTPVLGLDVPWWLTFLAVSMITALLAGRVVGVRF